MNRVSGFASCRFVAIPLVLVVVMLVIIFAGATAIAIVALVVWVVSAVVRVGVVVILGLLIPQMLYDPHKTENFGRLV